jgi:streptogramin lyase
MNHTNGARARADVSTIASSETFGIWSRVQVRLRTLASVAAAVALPLLFSLPAQAVTLLGPQYANLPLSPGGPPFTSSGSYGVGTGATWIFNAAAPEVPLAAQTSVWHGVDTSAGKGIRMTFNGGPFGLPGEVLTFDPSTSNLAGGILVFKGQTVFPDSAPTFTRVTLRYQNLASAPVAVVDPSTIGAPAGIGGALFIPAPPNGFQLSYLAEAAPALAGPYSPAQTYFTNYAASHLQSWDGLLHFSFDAAFYWNNVPPVLNFNTGTSVNQGASVTITAAMLQATDLESDSKHVTYTIPTSNGGTTHIGTLYRAGVPLVNGSTFTQNDIDNNLITYTAVTFPDCNTSDDFEFTVSDENGGITPTQPGSYSFKITLNLVNNPPVAVNGSFSVGLGAQHTGTFAATNADCFAPTYTFGPGTLPTKGTLVVTNASTGAFTYTATPGQSGADSFTFTVNDGVVAANPNGVYNVTITNQPPVAQDQTIATNEGTPVNGTLSATDVDVPPQPLTYSIVTNGTKGTAVVLDAAAGTFTYTPLPGRMGADTFTFKANDGALDSNVATVTVNIRGTLTPGRIVVSAGQVGGANKELVVVDPVTSDQSVVINLAATPGVALHGVAIPAAGKILAVDTNNASLILVDAASGTFVPLATALPGIAFGVAVEPNGNILVTAGPAHSVVRMDPSGAPLPGLGLSGGLLNAPLAVTVAGNGDIYVADAGAFVSAANSVIKIDPVTGTQTVVTSAGNLIAPVGIALSAAGQIFVTDSPQALGNPNPAPSQVIQIDPATGNQTVIANSGLILAPAGIAVAPDGTLLTANVLANAIVRIDLSGPTQSIVSGGGDLVGAYGLALFAPPPAMTKAVSRKVQGGAGTFDLPLTLLPPPP